MEFSVGTQEACLFRPDWPTTSLTDRWMRVHPGDVAGRGAPAGPILFPGRASPQDFKRIARSRDSRTRRDFQWAWEKKVEAPSRRFHLGELKGKALGSPVMRNETRILFSFLAVRGPTTRVAQSRFLTLPL